MTEYRNGRWEVGYRSLGMCIVWQAIKDYKTAKRKGNSGQVTAIQNFFKSDWCCQLCQFDADALIELLDRECARKEKT